MATCEPQLQEPVGIPQHETAKWVAHYTKQFCSIDNHQHNHGLHDAETYLKMLRGLAPHMEKADLSWLSGMLSNVGYVDTGKLQPKVTDSNQIRQSPGGHNTEVMEGHQQREDARALIQIYKAFGAFSERSTGSFMRMKSRSGLDSGKAMRFKAALDAHLGMHKPSTWANQMMGNTARILAHSTILRVFLHALVILSWASLGFGADFIPVNAEFADSINIDGVELPLASIRLLNNLITVAFLFDGAIQLISKPHRWWTNKKLMFNTCITILIIPGDNFSGIFFRTLTVLKVLRFNRFQVITQFATPVEENASYLAVGLVIVACMTFPLMSRFRLHIDQITNRPKFDSKSELDSAGQNFRKLVADARWFPGYCCSLLFRRGFSSSDSVSYNLLENFDFDRPYLEIIMLSLISLACVELYRGYFLRWVLPYEQKKDKSSGGFRRVSILYAVDAYLAFQALDTKGSGVVHTDDLRFALEQGRTLVDGVSSIFAQQFKGRVHPETADKYQDRDDDDDEDDEDDDTLRKHVPNKTLQKINLTLADVGILFPSSEIRCSDFLAACIAHQSCRLSAEGVQSVASMPLVFRILRLLDVIRMQTGRGDSIICEEVIFTRNFRNSWRLQDALLSHTVSKCAERIAVLAKICVVLRDLATQIWKEHDLRQPQHETCQPPPPAIETTSAVKKIDEALTQAIHQLSPERVLEVFRMDLRQQLQNEVKHYTLSSNNPPFQDSTLEVCRDQACRYPRTEAVLQMEGQNEAALEGRAPQGACQYTTSSYVRTQDEQSKQSTQEVAVQNGRDVSSGHASSSQHSDLPVSSSPLKSTLQADDIDRNTPSQSVLRSKALLSSWQAELRRGSSSRGDSCDTNSHITQVEGGINATFPSLTVAAPEDPRWNHLRSSCAQKNAMLKSRGSSGFQSAD